MTCGVAHMGFSGPLAFGIILQAILTDHWGSPFSFVLANLCGFLLPLLPPCCRVGAHVSMSLGKYLFHWVFFSVWRCQLAAAHKGGSRFQGCQVTSLLYFSHLAFPANLFRHQFPSSSTGDEFNENTSKLPFHSDFMITGMFCFQRYSNYSF